MLLHSLAAGWEERRRVELWGLKIFFLRTLVRYNFEVPAFDKNVWTNLGDFNS